MNNQEFQAYITVINFISIFWYNFNSVNSRIVKRSVCDMFRVGALRLCSQNDSYSNYNKVFLARL